MTARPDVFIPLYRGQRATRPLPVESLPPALLRGGKVPGRADEGCGPTGLDGNHDVCRPRNGDACKLAMKGFHQLSPKYLARPASTTCQSVASLKRRKRGRCPFFAPGRKGDASLFCAAFPTHALANHRISAWNWRRETKGSVALFLDGSSYQPRNSEYEIAVTRAPGCVSETTARCAASQPLMPAPAARASGQWRAASRPSRWGAWLRSPTSRPWTRWC